MAFDYFSWIILPILIFLSRLGDVTMATLRHIFISKGLRKIVPVLGFFEVLIWLVAMRQVFSHLDNVACFIAWALGFSAGTYLGMLIEERIALGTQVIRIITNEDTSGLIADLRSIHQGVTMVDAEGAMGPVKLLFTVVKRVNKAQVIAMIHQHSPHAFYSIEDVKSAHQGVFSNEAELSVIRRLFPIRKGK
ncbi:MAG: DUF2179 domain-containing protein [Bacteroidetes bacterium]|nr:DUF2179 domain-containing protein [Bacteroidota bacterium]